MRYEGKDYIYWGDHGWDSEGREWRLQLRIPDDQFATVEDVLMNSEVAQGNGEAQERLALLRRIREHGLGDCMICGEHVDEGWWTTDEKHVLCHKHIDHRHRGYLGLIGREQEGVVTVYEVPFEKIEELRGKERERHERKMKWHEDLKAQGKECCTRCGGYGIIEAYRRVNGGVCFDCNGRGWIEGRK